MQLFIGSVLNDGKIIDKKFKIHIPVLMPKITAGTNTVSTNIKVDRLLNKSAINSSSVVGRNYIEAETMTDYMSRLDNANVFQMERVDGATEVDTTNTAEKSLAMQDYRAADTYIPVPMNCLISGAPHVPHVHRILGSMKFYKMKITNLNNIDIKSGDKCLVMMIGSKFYITKFIGKIPQDSADYYKN